MNRNLLIAATLIGFGLHVVAGCCSHHGHESVHSTYLCAETAPEACGASQFGCDACQQKTSGKSREESRCVWLSDNGPMFEFEPNGVDSAACDASQNATEAVATQFGVQTGNDHHHHRPLHRLFSVWLI